MPVNRTIGERLAAQANRVETRRVAMLRERDRLDGLIAEAVTTRPDSAQWYAYPGELTIEEAVKFAGGGAAGIAAALDRQRKRLAEADGRPVRRRAKSSRKSSSSAKRAATRRTHQP